jgi:hypothetical protein
MVSEIKLRIFLNTFGSIFMFVGALFFFFLRDTIDNDTYIQRDFFEFRTYTYAATGILLLGFFISFFFVTLDLSLCYHIPYINDLRDWYAAEIAALMDYQTVDTIRIATKYKLDD